MVCAALSMCFILVNRTQVAGLRLTSQTLMATYSFLAPTMRDARRSGDVSEYGMHAFDLSFGASVRLVSLQGSHLHQSAPGYNHGVHHRCGIYRWAVRLQCDDFRYVDGAFSYRCPFAPCMRWVFWNCIAVVAYADDNPNVVWSWKTCALAP